MAVKQTGTVGLFAVAVLLTCTNAMEAGADAPAPIDHAAHERNIADAQVHADRLARLGGQANAGALHQVPAAAAVGAHRRVMNGLKAHIEAHPTRAKITGYFLGGATALLCPHVVIAHGLGAAVGHGIAYHSLCASTVAVGAKAGELGADLAANGRNSDIVYAVDSFYQLSDSTVEGLQAAALAGPVGAGLVLAPGGVALVASGALHSTLAASAVAGGAAVAGTGAGVYYGRDAAREAEEQVFHDAQPLAIADQQ